MRMPRFSIAALLAFVLICGLGLAALKAASGMWASVMVTIAAVALLTSVVGAAKGRNRAGWLGFAVFGCGYVAFNFAPWCHEVISPHLLTTLAIVESFRYVHPGPHVLFEVEPPRPGRVPDSEPAFYFPNAWDDDIGPSYQAVAGVGPARSVSPTPGGHRLAFGPGDFSAYLISGHALMTNLVGLLGWIIASLIADRRRECER